MTARRGWMQTGVPYTPKKRRAEVKLEDSWLFTDSAFKGDRKAVLAHIEKLRRGNKK